MKYWENIEWERFLGDAFATGIILLGAFAIWLVLSRALKALEARAKVSSTLLMPLKLLLRYGVVLVALLLCLTAYGIPIGSFWTLVSTTLGLVAIGFVAVWSVLSNISSTFLIMIAHPFRVGDYVSLVGEEVMGRVVDINFLFTTIRKGSGDVFMVPNNQFFQKCLLHPVDPSKLEAGAEPKDPEASIDHSQANLEGIELPTAPARAGGR